MHRFYVDKKNIFQDSIIINSKEDINHITKVLRLDNNNIIIVCDGNGVDYQVKIKSINKDSIFLSLTLDENKNPVIS